MRFTPFLRPIAKRDQRTFVSDRPYMSLEEAINSLLTKGKVDMPTHPYNSFDFPPGTDVRPEDLDNPAFARDMDKYEAANRLRKLQAKPNPTKLPEASESSQEAPKAPATSPAPEGASEGSK